MAADDDGYNDDDISIECMVIIRDIEILSRENVKGLASLLPDRVRWAKVNGYWAAMTVYEKARAGVAEAEWLVYHLHRQGIAGFDRLLTKQNAYEFLSRSGRKNFAPAMYEAVLHSFSRQILSQSGSLSVEDSEAVEKLLYVASCLGSMDAYYFYSIVGELERFATPQHMGTEEAVREAASRGHPDALVKLAKLLIQRNQFAEALFYSRQINPCIRVYNNFTGICRAKEAQGDALTAFCEQRCGPKEKSAVMRLAMDIDRQEIEDLRRSTDDRFTRQIFHMGDPLYVYKQPS